MRLDTSFCMDSGQVRTGDDDEDTYIKMLQEIKMITVSMAHGIAVKYPGVSRLLNGFKELGPIALEDVRVCQPVKIRLCSSSLISLRPRNQPIWMESFLTGGLDQLPAGDYTLYLWEQIPRLPIFELSWQLV